MDDPAVPNLAWSVYNWRIWLGSHIIFTRLICRAVLLVGLFVAVLALPRPG